ncbi:hypothetical protein J1605_017881 [Eschrichtius robustus]|uniref:Uncharacterized protein n=1 Tax=Eschrichtius robustus TaxID=9764 RepID=A0AB34I0F6_ESCRO|nr:hypothetical protein J1605_017881 [Eschrichtius robustus]
MQVRATGTRDSPRKSSACGLAAGRSPKCRPEEVPGGTHAPKATRSDLPARTGHFRSQGLSRIVIIAF